MSAISVEKGTTSVPLYHYKKYKDDYDKRAKTNASRVSVKNILKYVKKIIRAFTAVNNKLQQLTEYEYDLSDSQEEDKAPHFHIPGKSGFQFSQLNEEFETRITDIFNQSVVRTVGINTKIDLREVIILDRQ